MKRKEYERNHHITYVDRRRVKEGSTITHMMVREKLREGLHIGFEKKRWFIILCATLVW